ncbi:MAG: hypothetical protein QME68_00245 [Elusimicrobiota bacterium]|nr:hypothetical protein [Elusimicrobiota bacterium]
MISITEAKEKFKDEWLAFVVKKKGSDGEIVGEVLEHDKDKRAIHRRLREKKIKYAYITFAGPYVRPGYEIMF